MWYCRIRRDIKRVYDDWREPSCEVHAIFSDYQATRPHPGFLSETGSTSTRWSLALVHRGWILHVKDPNLWCHRSSPALLCVYDDRRYLGERKRQQYWQATVWLGIALCLAAMWCNVRLISNSVTSIHFQIQLHIVADTVILKCELIFEWSFSLSFEQDLMRFPSDHRGNDNLEILCGWSVMVTRHWKLMRHLLTESDAKHGIAFFVPSLSLTVTMIIGC